VQTVTTRLSPGRYEPITVQKGIPVKWTIRAEQGDINGCNNSIIIPKYGKEIDLKNGDNLIEFTPDESGTVPFSCWMGMIRSSITVVDDINKAADATSAPQSPESSQSEPSVPQKPAPDYKLPVDDIAVAEIRDGIQYVDIDMNADGFSPAVIVLQSGIEAQMTVNAAEIGEGEYRTLIFPLYYAQVNTAKGKNPLRLMPQADFDFSPVGDEFFAYVKVVDDLQTVDLGAIRQEARQYIPSVWSFDPNSAGGASCH
jgi:hypothetical protein